jgi:hypothetical protein
MYDKIGDLMYQVENIEATLTYCRDHNVILQDYPADSLKDEFFKRVMERAGELKTDKLVKIEGQMETAFNAFYVIDSFNPLSASVPMVPGVTYGTHVINFLVRLGRQPVQQASAEAPATTD